MQKIRAILRGEIPAIEFIEATCDICGANCIQDGNFEGMELKADWGFNGKNGQRWRAIICENCVDRHFSSLINFEVKTSDICFVSNAVKGESLYHLQET